MLDKAMNNVDKNYTIDSKTLNDTKSPVLDISVRSRIISKLFFNSKKVDMNFKNESDNTTNDEKDQNYDYISQRLLDRNLFKTNDFHNQKNFFYKTINEQNYGNNPNIPSEKYQDKEFNRKNNMKSSINNNIQEQNLYKNDKYDHIATSIINKKTNQIRNAIDIDSDVDIIQQAKIRFRSIFDNKEQSIKIAVDWV